jgi:hypothetical protein
MTSGLFGFEGKGEDWGIGAVLRGTLERETDSHRSVFNSWMSPGFEGPASEEGANVCFDEGLVAAFALAEAIAELAFETVFAVARLKAARPPGRRGGGVAEDEDEVVAIGGRQVCAFGKRWLVQNCWLQS